MTTFKDILRLVRWQGRRFQQSLKFGKLDAPVLFGNSFPKSGTHLVTQILAGFSQLGPVVNSGLPAVTIFDGPTGEPRPMKTILREVRRFRPGDVGYGHLHAEPEIMAGLCRDGVAPYFILRDLRDVVVSHVFYVTEKNSQHVHHEYYSQVLTTFDERLNVSIEGRPELDIPFPDIAARFEPYKPWLERPEVLTLRYEDFITNNIEAVGKVFDHAVARGFRYTGSREVAVAKLVASINPSESPTFRSGKVGGWKEYFTPAHKALFKQVAGDLLITLGYEKDMDW